MSGQPSPTQPARPSREALLPLLLVALVYLATLGLIDRRGFWVLDNAAKFVQMESILRSGFSDYSIPVPGGGLDPGRNLNPVPFPFGRIVEGKVYPVFSPVFAVVSSVPYRIFGQDGLYLLPLLFSLLALLGVGRIALTLGWRHVRLAILLAGLCTPLWFYSAVFWEHAIAVCLCIWSVWLHLVHARTGRAAPLVLGFALCAAGVWFRDELYLFLLVLLALQLWDARHGGWRRGGRIVALAAAICLAVLLPLWLFQWKAIGRPFGFHLETHVLKTSGTLMHLSQRPRVLYNLLLTSHESVALSLVFALPVLLAFVLRPKLPWRTFRIALPALGGFATLGTVVTLSGFARPAGPILALDYSNSLFACVPVLALGLLRCDQAPGLGSKGIHWGNRFLLVLYALLAVPATGNVLRWFDGLRASRAASAGASTGPLQRGFPRPAWVLIPVFAAAFAAQCYSIGLLGRVTDFSNRLNTAIEARPGIVLMTDTFWLPEFLHRQFLEREIYLVRSEETVRYFRARMQEMGRAEYLYLTARPNPPPVEPDLLVDDGGLKFYTVRGYRQTVGAGP